MRFIQITLLHRDSPDCRHFDDLSAVFVFVSWTVHGLVQLILRYPVLVVFFSTIKRARWLYRRVLIGASAA